MSTGIWTPVANTTKLVTFGEPLLRNFVDRVRSITTTAGPHVRFVSLGCLPLFVVSGAVPTTDADALARGVPVGTEDTDIIAMAPGTYTLYSPYESLSVLFSEGTLT